MSGLLYLFLGIGNLTIKKTDLKCSNLKQFKIKAIIADIFMCAIEKITSKTTVIKYPDPNDPNRLIDREVKM